MDEEKLTHSPWNRYDGNRLSMTDTGQENEQGHGGRTSLLDHEPQSELRINVPKLFDTVNSLYRSNPEKNEESVLGFVGLLHPTSKKKWTSDEYTEVLSLFSSPQTPSRTNASAKEEEIKLTFRKLILDDAQRKGFDRDAISQDSEQVAARKNPNGEPMFNVLDRQMNRTIHTTSVMDLYEKKKSVNSLIDIADNDEKKVFRSLYNSLEAKQSQNDFLETTAMEISIYSPEDFASAGNEDFDKRFEGTIRMVQDASDDANIHLLKNIYESEKLDIIRNGLEEHKQFLKVLEGRIQQLEIKEAEMKQYESRSNHMQPFSEGQAQLKESDIPLYDGSIDSIIQERISRILDDPRTIAKWGQFSMEDKKYYYDALRRWVGVVLKNATQTESKLNSLVLKPERYDRLKKIFENDNATEEEIMQDVMYLNDKKGGRLTHYFMRKVGGVVGQREANGRINYAKATYKDGLIGPNPLKDNKEESEQRRYRGELPETLEQTVEYIVAQYGQHYPLKTGEECELIDRDGKFHIENFSWWIKSHSIYLENENPMSKIDPLGQIVIKIGYTQVTLTDIVYSDQFRQQTQFIIQGNELKNENAISGTWGGKEEHPEFSRQDAEMLLYEAHYFALFHNSTANWRQSTGDEKGFIKSIQEISLDAFVSRGNIFIFAKMPSRLDGTDKEFRERGDGTLGRAWREMVVAYAHLTDFTTFTKYNPRDWRVREKVGGAVAKEEKSFEHNMFYNWLEANGSNAFLHSLAEESLKDNPQVMKIYKNYILERLETSQEEYIKTKNINPNQREQIRQIFQIYREGIEKDRKGFEIKSPEFTTSEVLTNFHKKIEKSVFGRKINPEINKKIKNTIKKDILTNLKNGFFDKIVDLPIDDIGEKTKKRTGTTTPFGDKKFGEGKDKKTMKQIFDEFASVNTIENYNKFVDYDKNHKPDTTSEAFKKFLKTNETLALASAQIIAGVSRTELNPFAGEKGSGHLPSKKYAIETAIQKGVAEKAYGLDPVESTYVWMYAKNTLMPFGIAAQLDTVGISFDYWAKILRLREHCLRQLNRGYPIVQEFADEVHFLGMPLLEMIPVKSPGENKAENSLMSVFEGREQNGKVVKAREDRLLNGTYLMTEGAQMNFIFQHIQNAVQLFERLKSGEFDFSKAAKTDPLTGLTVIDKEAVINLNTKLWTNIRYSTDQSGVTYDRIINRDGCEDDILHHQLEAKTLNILEDYVNLQYGGDKRKGYDAPGIAIFTSLLASVIKERREDPSEHRWPLHVVQQVLYQMEKIHREPALKYGSRLFPEFVAAALETYDTSYEKMFFKETYIDTWVLCWFFGLKAALEEFANRLPAGSH